MPCGHGNGAVHRWKACVGLAEGGRGIPEPRDPNANDSSMLGYFIMMPREAVQMRRTEAVCAVPEGKPSVPRVSMSGRRMTAQRTERTRAASIVQDRIHHAASEPSSYQDAETHDVAVDDARQ